MTELEPNDPFSFTQLSVICQRCGLIPEAEEAMATARMMEAAGALSGALAGESESPNLRDAVLGEAVAGFHHAARFAFVGAGWSSLTAGVTFG